MKIGETLVGGDAPVYVIAEAGVNHNGSLEAAIRLVDVAVQAGAQAVKFQMFQADQLASEQADLANYQQGNDRYHDQKSMLKQYELSKESFHQLKTYCDQQNITFLATPFDFASAETLHEMGVTAFKLSSGDLTHLPLLEQISSYRKPMILSTGMATMGEIERSLDFLGSKAEVVLLHCTSSYPAPPEETNLRVMKTLANAFGRPTGFSDHTEGLEIPLAATALGAAVIEKHFTLSRSMEGPDHASSLEPGELNALIKGIRKVESALGHSQKKVAKAETDTLMKVRRGIYAARDLPRGHRLTVEDFHYLRPLKDKGWSAGEFRELIGTRVRLSKQKGEWLRRGDIIDD